MQIEFAGAKVNYYIRQLCFAVLALFFFSQESAFAQYTGSCSYNNFLYVLYDSKDLSCLGVPVHFGCKIAGYYSNGTAQYTPEAVRDIGPCNQDYEAVIIFDRSINSDTIWGTGDIPTCIDKNLLTTFYTSTQVPSCGSVPTPTPAATVTPSPPSAFNLSISGISFSQPVGTSVPTDSSGNPVISTITPPTAKPAPAITPLKVQATVTVLMSGIPSGPTATDVRLMLGNVMLADQSVDVSQFQQGANQVLISFTPPTDPDLLGVNQLTATINSSHALTESDYSNNSFAQNVDLMVLCQVANAGRVVPFYAQSTAPWGSEPFGIPSISSGSFTKYGCSVTDVTMLFSSYGINHVPLGSPANPYGTSTSLPGLRGESLDPESFNYAMANYRTNYVLKGSVALDAHNNPWWPGAVEVARAGYQAQCKLSGTCDPANATSVVSYKSSDYSGFTPDEAIDAI